MRKAILGTALVLVTVGLVAAACGGGGGEQTSSQSPATTKPSQTAASPQTTSQSPATTGPSQTAASPQATAAPAGALTVTQVNYRFQPDSLSVQSGKTVTVNLVNNGTAPHTFTITELAVDKTLSPGETATVTFTSRTAGTFTYFCRFHRSSGMEGKLQVS